MIEDGHAFISIRRKVTLLQHRDDSQQQFPGSGKWTTPGSILLPTGWSVLTMTVGLCIFLTHLTTSRDLLTFHLRKEWVPLAATI